MFLPLGQEEQADVKCTVSCDPETAAAALTATVRHVLQGST